LLYSPLPSVPESERKLFVPVGEDQVPHVELTREVARRFNQFYCFRRTPVSWGSGYPLIERNHPNTFVEPKPLLTPAAKLPGTDGRKMSKSYGNTILLSEPEASLRQKLKTMVTDPARIRRTDPGNPDVCPVGDLHKIFSTAETMAKVNEGCRTAGIGCIECKQWASDSLWRVLGPMQERRQKYEANPKLAWDILEQGSTKARAVAEATMVEARAAANLSHEYEAPAQSVSEGK
jgi:tryptophanyl-tRNA synthetase